MGQVASIILRVSWPWVGVAAAGVVLVSVCKALRWLWLYPLDAKSVSGFGHFSILLIAQMLNLVVPIRLGEIARLGLMQQEGRPAGMTLGTIVVEKSLDLVAVGVILMLVVPMSVLPDWLQARAGPGALLTALALLAALLILGVVRRPLLGWLQAIPIPRREPWARWQRRILALLRSTLDGIAGIEGRRMVPVLGLTALAWLISALVVQVVLLAFGLEDQWHAAVVLMIALIFSNLVPTPPAMIGLVGAVTEGVLIPFGVDQALALAIGTILNAVLVAPPVLLGGWAAGARLLRLLATARQGRLRRALGLAPLDTSGSR